MAGWLHCFLKCRADAGYITVIITPGDKDEERGLSLGPAEVDDNRRCRWPELCSLDCGVGRNATSTMSSNRFTPRGYPRVPLQNGIGRYVCQLKRITLRFCKSSGSSRGVRDFIETSLVSFAEDHPGTVVYLKPRRHKSPSFVAEYLNGERQVISCHNFTALETVKWLNLYTTRSGIPLMRYMKMWHTDCPSIQGVWSPFTNKDPALNVTRFPSKEYSKPAWEEKSATEELLEMVENQQLDSDSDDDTRKTRATRA